MDKPKCRLCGQKHWGLCVVPEEKESPEEDVQGEPGGLPGDDAGVLGKEAIRKRKWRELNHERYNTYMREYMRRKRAEG